LKGRIYKKQIVINTSAAADARDCDGNIIPGQGLPASSDTSSTLVPATFTTAIVKVFSPAPDSSAGKLAYTFTNAQNLASWSYNSSTGDFQVTLTGLAKSRFNYIAKLYLDGAGTSSYSEEFMLNSVPGIPVGTIWAYMGDGNDLTDLAVSGWYLCNGSAISSLTELDATEKSDLQAFFTRSGKASPEYLPDLRGMFIRGMDKSSGNDPDAGSRTGGNAIGSVQGDGLQSHNHTGTADQNGSHSHTGTTDNGGSSGSERASNADVSTKQVGGDSGGHTHTFTTNSAGTHDHNLSINNTGGLETRPKNVYVNYIIKCRK
jgi:hypothetical protein